MFTLPVPLQIPTLLVIILAALVLIFTNRLRADVVALMVLLTLAICGLVSTQQALSGFSNPAIITIIGLFIISRGLEETGVVDWVAQQLQRLGGTSERRLIILLMGAGALLSMIMNTVAAAAVLLPAAVQVGVGARVKASRLLIPMASGVLVGGMATYFSTPNIVLSGLLIERGLPGLNMFSFMPIGAMITIAAIAYMALIGLHQLPDRASPSSEINTRRLSQTLFEEYELDERMWELRVLPSSRLANVQLCDSHIGAALGVTVLGIWRGNEAILTPEPTETIRTGDFLLILGREDRVAQLHEWGLVMGRQTHFDYYRPNRTVDLTEVVIPPRSRALGKTLTELRFRGKYGLTSVAMWRGGRNYRTDVGKMPLELGDALLMVGAPAQMEMLQREDDYLVIRSGHQGKPRQTKRARWAILITMLVLLASIFEIIPTAEAMLAGAVGMVLAGCLTMDEAYRQVEWRVIFLIAGMLPLSIAMSNTGLAEQLGTLIVNLLSPFGGLALIGGMFLMTMALSQVLSAQVTAIVLGPIALSAALTVGVNTQAMAIAIALACSTAFLTPIAHPVNLLVMGPGGYVPSDFLKTGIPLTILTFVLTLLGVAVIYGVR